ncbi:hypothetical protein CLAFUW4_10176 [Fulvia fulva]|uniref:F-box domain-containing protein n=1 Tax=Passalora fulva TaxID=5499 RepID=A0A9Q8P7A8_PASFU|nr:uncharacterized protein CLAFUR5_04789 [Fulvia fulva]KAK4616088.1 hypothetical protein CLAFUR4_10180 [Fulvia fulva]KAK4616611.1 hypothetical protein CLAFUR0_10178 [Fulvia fulva]UJO15960.1 hypothetical protein CLAFUR5_04789 [Fulvia fulva]WPV19521.1 hypothetical protein CLAFUW4_10176 [Fulvia fulva]WPV33722.1 hypothetical protein CLAFUW7_10176 [Fulvia fulva]
MSHPSDGLTPLTEPDTTIVPAIRASINLLDLPAEILERIFEYTFTIDDIYSLYDLVDYRVVLPWQQVGHPRLTISGAWYAAALRPFLRTATLSCGGCPSRLNMPGAQMSAFLYSVEIARMESFKRLWITSISCPLPVEGGVRTAWETYLQSVLPKLPNLRSLRLTGVTTKNTSGLRPTRGTSHICTSFLEKATWINAVVARPRLQRFLATSATEDIAVMKEALKLAAYVQIRMMARNDPRGVARWTGGRDGIGQFCNDLRIVQDELQPHAMTLRTVFSVLPKILQLRGYWQEAEDYKTWMKSLKATMLTIGKSPPSRDQEIAPVAVAA